jgi:predicted RNA binding protein YcfA (HicA-like mRNA interferase family)
VPKKIRELKAMLRKAGFTMRPGKGSHSVWSHVKLMGKKVTIAGNDGDDAKTFLEQQVNRAIKEAEQP